MTFARYGCLPLGHAPVPLWQMGDPAISSSAAMNTADFKAAMIGPVVWADGATHAIRSVGVRLGAIVVGTGTTTVRVSLQDVLVTGSALPLRPDGTVDQSWSSAIGSLNQNTLNTAQLDADRAAVAPGTMLAVVIDFSAFGTGPSLAMAGVSTFGSGTAQVARLGFVQSSDAGATWANQQRHPIVIFVADDGTIGTLGGSVPVDGISSTTWDNAAADFERGLEFVAPHTFKLAGALVWYRAVDADCDVDVKVYQGDTLVQTVSIPYEELVTNTGIRPTMVSFPDLTITKDSTYRIMVAPSTVNDVRMATMTFTDATHRAAMWGTFMSYNTKQAGGFQTPSTTTLPWIVPIPAGYDDGAGGAAAGGSLTHSRLLGR